MQSTGSSPINFLAPGKPMMELIENQVYLAQGAYAKVIGTVRRRCWPCAERCTMTSVALHVQPADGGALMRNWSNGDEALGLLQAGLRRGRSPTG